MNNAIGTLGIAARARKIVTGDMLISSITKKKIKLVIISEEIGNNSRKKLIDKCTFYNVAYVFVKDIDLMNIAIGQANRMAIGISDEGFAQKLHTCLKG